MNKRFELYLYDGCGKGKSEYFDHLEDLMERAEEFVGDDVEMTSQFEAFDKSNGKDISHKVGVYLMEGMALTYKLNY